MIIYPAIDLLGGRCVRLQQGQYDNVTVYHNDPVQMAIKFKQAGASWLHIVDLDAARSGVPVHSKLIQSIREETGLHIQTGGGIRTMDHLKALIDEYSIDRVVLGTAAVKDRSFTEAAIKQYADRIAIGIDASDGEVKVDGWTIGSGIDAFAFARLMADIGAKTVIYTDIRRDGMLVGSATEDISRMVAIRELDVIASGGIGSWNDIESVRKTGAAGVIVGKAIYEGKVRLEKCWQKE